MITLYGSAPTRATRVAWLLEELGLEYALVHAFDPRTDEYGALNPNRKVPTLVDDGFVVWESMACNLYLARKYGGALWPDSLEDQTRATMWSFWVMTEVERPILDTMSKRRSDPDGVKAAHLELERPFGVLEAHLADRPCLLGEVLSVADFNVDSVVKLGHFGGLDFGPYPHIADWDARLGARDSFKNVTELPMSPPPPM